MNVSKIAFVLGKTAYKYANKARNGLISGTAGSIAGLLNQAVNRIEDSYTPALDTNDPQYQSRAQRHNGFQQGMQRGMSHGLSGAAMTGDDYEFC